MENTTSMSTAKNPNLDQKTGKIIDREDLARVKADKLRANFAQNSKYNTGAEVEDLVFKTDEKGNFQPLNNHEAENLLEDINNYLGDAGKLKEETIDGTNVKKAVSVEESPFQQGEDPFRAEIDNDLNPRQSEVATDVVRNPADLMFRLEYLRRVRDEQLDEHDVYEVALSPETMFDDIEGDLTLEEYQAKGDVEAENRPGERYTALSQSHGGAFDFMASPAATQLNTGLPVGEDLSLDELIFWMENAGSGPALADVTQAESALFDADPIVKSEKGEYETVIESGREMLYDLFIAESDAADREEAEERWGDELEKALPSNNNYGRLGTTRDAWTAEDLLGATMSAPGIMSTEIKSSDVYWDEEHAESLAEELENQDTWVVFDNNRMNKDLGQALEDGEYTAKFLKDGELVDVYVKHNVEEDSVADSSDYFDLAENYVDMQATFVRPDLALKMAGIGEGRNYSNSPRTNQAVLDQKGLWMKIPEIQEQYEKELTGEEAAELREKVNKQGLDTDALGLRSLQRENMEIKAQGLRESFPENELPYTFEVVAKDYLEKSETTDQSFEQFLDESFSDFESFLDYQISEFENNPGKQGEFQAEDWAKEYSEFQDWFVETAYEQPMNEYLEQPTVNQQILEEANKSGSKEAYRALRRTEN